MRPDPPKSITRVVATVKGSEPVANTAAGAKIGHTGSPGVEVFCWQLKLKITAKHVEFVGGDWCLAMFLVFV